MPRIVPGLLGGALHGLRFCVVHGHGLLAENVLAGAQGRDRLGAVEAHRSGDVHGVGRTLRERRLQFGPGGDAVGLGLGEVAGHEAAQPAARFGEDSGKYALRGDVADAENQPAQHRAIILRRRAPVDYFLDLAAARRAERFSGSAGR